MAVQPKQVLAVLEAFAPAAQAQDFDNVGLLVDAQRPVTQILTCLDITPAVVTQAAKKGCEMIVSHHPVIFDALKRIRADDIPALLLKSEISAICMHTNLDAAAGGVNDVLAARLGLCGQTQPIAEGCGRMGNLPTPTTAAAIATLCQKVLGEGVRYVEAAKPVQKLAVVSGAGGSFLPECVERGADCLVTGEAAHHIALLAHKTGIGLVVAGHWATEHPIAETLADLLAQQLPDLKVYTATSDRDPFCYL